MLGFMSNDVLVQLLFRDHPTMDVKRGNTQAHQKIVILITNLLKSVYACLPKCRKFDFNSLARNKPIRLRVGTRGDIEALGSSPT